MSSLEFARWKFIAKKYHLGFGTENHMLGTIAATIVNTTPRGKGAKAYTPTDFYP